MANYNRKKDINPAPVAFNPTPDMYEIRPLWEKKNFIAEQESDPERLKALQYRARASFVIIKFKEDGGVDPVTGRRIRPKNAYTIFLPEEGGPGTPGPSLDQVKMGKEHSLADMLYAIRNVDGCYEKGSKQGELGLKEGKMFELYHRTVEELQAIKRGLTPEALKDARRAAKGLKDSGIIAETQPDKAFSARLKAIEAPDDTDDDEVEAPAEGALAEMEEELIEA